MDSTRSPWINPPRQARSRRTLQRLLDAAEAMLDEGTFEEATIPLIVQRAGSSVGSFYSLFKGKDALFECLMDRHEERVLRLVTEFFADDDRWQSASFAERTEAWVDLVVSYCCDERGVMRARLLRNIGDTESIPEHRRHNVRTIIERIRAFFQPSMHEVTHPQTEEALDFALMCVDYVAGYRILLEDPRGRYFGEIDRSRLQRELSRLVLSYLGVGECGKSPAGSPTTKGAADERDNSGRT